MLLIAFVKEEVTGRFRSVAGCMQGLYADVSNFKKFVILGVINIVCCLFSESKNDLSSGLFCQVNVSGDTVGM